MKVLCTVLFLLLSFKSYPQFFVKSFDPATPISNSGSGIAVKCADGNLMVFSKSLMKFNINGDVIWAKDFGFTSITEVLRGRLLSDSSVGFLLTAPDSSIGSILKVDNDGNVLWFKKIYGNANQSIYGMEGDSLGGLFLVCGGYPIKNATIHVDKNGNILNGFSHTFTSPSLNTYIGYTNQDAGDEFSCLGVALNSVSLANDLAFFKTNINGDIYLYKEIVIDSLNLSTIGFGSIVKSTSNGHFCFYSIEASHGAAYDKFALFYLDAGNHVEWGRLISTPGHTFFPLILNPTSDNGCLISTSHIYNNPKALFNILKFDSTGTLQWTKTIGDTNIVSQSYLQPIAMLPMQTNAWMSFYSTPDVSYYFHLAKTDSLMNGFCNYSQTAIQSSSLVYQQNDYTSSSFPEIYTTTDGIISISSNFLTENIECVSTGISNRKSEKYPFSIFPNPVSSFAYLRMEFPDKSSHLEMNIINSEGLSLLTLPLENTKENSIDLSFMKEGVYFYIISDKKTILFSSKFNIIKQ